MQLKTERLVLRPMVQSDAAALFAILGDPQAMRFWHRPVIGRLAVVEDLVHEQIEASGYCRYWTAWRDDDAIGSCDLSFIDHDTACAETGFLFRRDQWGQGYAGEAMRAVTAHAFTALQLDRLTARTHVQNGPARRVLERLGFTLEQILFDHAPIPGVRMDCAAYVLRRDESMNQNGA